MKSGSVFSRLLAIPVFCGGVAALSWELLWQHYASLALGVSARGTAITLSATMTGMALGSLIAGRLLKTRWRGQPLRLYAALEGIIGLSGCLLAPAFENLSLLDVILYRHFPALAPLLYLLGVGFILGFPSLAMGATIPVFGLLAHRFRTSLSRLYGFNTAGAAAGVLLLAFYFLPHFGVQATTAVIAMINLSVAGAILLFPLPAPPSSLKGSMQESDRAKREIPFSFPAVSLLVFLTGFAGFTLEVAWFRVLRAVFSSTTDTFAIILFSALFPLALGARFVPFFRRRKISLLSTLLAAGFLILLATPLVGRIDQLTTDTLPYWPKTGSWLGVSLLLMGPAFFFLGIPLPWFLDSYRNSAKWALLYGINTIGAVTGAMSAAWVFLSLLGSIATASLAGFPLLLFALFFLRDPGRRTVLFLLAAVLGVAIFNDSKAGRVKAIGEIKLKRPYRILASREGPDVTTAVMDSKRGRTLLIDGFSATGELRNATYMDWMGRLPMLLHPDPKTALVIAMGTGQTAEGIRDENPARIDIVDVNPAVFAMAHYFRSNRDVLHDPRVRAIVMDGRAWLKRTTEHYDVITLEPMPPHFAGMNALYSREFYEIMKNRLNKGAIVSQWLPFHLLTPEHAVAIAAAFRTIFKESILWVDPRSGTGILLGRYGLPFPDPAEPWPGFSRKGRIRQLKEKEILAAVRLSPSALNRYADLGIPVTDDNQLLAYGKGRFDKAKGDFKLLPRINLNLVDKIAGGATLP